MEARALVLRMSADMIDGVADINNKYWIEEIETYFPFNELVAHDMADVLLAKL